MHDNQLQIFGDIWKDASPRYGLNGTSPFALGNFCARGLWCHRAQILHRKVNEMKSTERFADLSAGFTKERQRKNSTKRKYKVKFRPRVRDSQGELKLWLRKQGHTRSKTNESVHNSFWSCSLEPFWAFANSRVGEWRPNVIMLSSLAWCWHYGVCATPGYPVEWRSCFTVALSAVKGDWYERSFSDLVRTKVMKLFLLHSLHTRCAQAKFFACKIFESSSTKNNQDAEPLLNSTTP